MLVTNLNSVTDLTKNRMLEPLLLLVAVLIGAGYSLTRMHNDEYRISTKSDVIHAERLRITFGQLIPTINLSRKGETVGFYLSALKPWPRGPLELMLTSPVSTEELDRALLALGEPDSIIEFIRVTFHFNDTSLAQIIIKKPLFNVTVNYDIPDIKIRFTNALFKLRK